MKNVLIIAYYFPPIGGAGVQRTLKFVKYLPSFGFQPIVLMPNPNLVRYVKDFGLMGEVPQNVRVYQTFILDLNWLFKILYGFKLNRIVYWIGRQLIFPDYQREWLFWAKRKIRHIMKHDKIDLVFISSPPHSIQILGPWIKKMFRIPVVADFRDPLTYNYETKSPNLFNKCFKFEKHILSEADFIIANTSFNGKKYENEFEADSRKIEIITNGFDPDDFKSATKVTEENSKIIFSHIGRFYGEYNARPLINALATVRARLHDVEFRFVGGLISQDRKEIQKLGLEKYITIIDYCSHDEALKYNRESDYLLLILSDESFRGWIPAKTFEYINSGKKILAIVPENGDCAKIIRETNTGIVVSPEKTDRIAEIILDFAENSKNSDFLPNHAMIRKFDRRNLTRKLASVFHKVLSQDKDN
ncbi:MAG: glycosyltransferase [Calditrichia bacterium]